MPLIPNKISSLFNQKQKQDSKTLKISPDELQITKIAIYGFADTYEGEPLYQDAFNAAKVLAEVGYTIVDGGGPGVMKAATLGAESVGGKTIAITFDPAGATNFEGQDKSNPADTVIRTNNYAERTIALMKEGHVYVIFKGGTGTISEFGMAWGLARLYLGHHKPVILYGEFWKNVITALVENLNIRHEELKVIKIVTSPQEILDAIEEFKSEYARGEHEEMCLPSEFSLC